MVIRTLPSSRLLELAKLIRERKDASQTNPISNILDEVGKNSSEIQTIQEVKIPTRDEAYELPQVMTTLDRYGNTITLNAAQTEAVRTVISGENSIIIGPAGTGKTTAQAAVVSEVQAQGLCGQIKSEGHPTLISNTPGIVVCAYTRRAVANIKRSMPENLKGNCLTIHKLLAYAPVRDEVWDDEKGEMRKTMAFKPTYNANKPLPSSIKFVVVEEASMLGLDLWGELEAALPHKPQYIMLGDIEQLPPVFGPATLGFRLLEWKVTLLTEVYRQALESPILRLAHRILSGVPIKVEEFKDLGEKGKLTLHPWKKKIDDVAATVTCGAFFKAAYDSGAYIPGEDMILIPYNKAFGTIEINKYVANFIAKKFGHVVHHVIAGFSEHYLRVGETVMYDKEDAEIVDIVPNPEYSGKEPKFASASLDYWGHDAEELARAKMASEEDEDDDDTDMDILLANVVASGEDRVKKASHAITLRMINSEATVNLTSAGDVNKLLLGYALTVHKAQGSEWRKIFFLLHQSHAKMVQRELLYTAVTRAREELYVICEPNSFENGIKSQRVKGNTLAEKAEYFKGKQKQLGFSEEGS